MNNKDLLKLVKKYDSPLYVYDGNVIVQQYERLHEAFKTVPALKINYACKALSNLSVLKLFQKLGSGLDTVSVQEVQLGLAAGFATLAPALFAGAGVVCVVTDQK